MQKRRLLLVLFLFAALAGRSTLAQSLSFGDYVRGNAADIETLMSAYLEPMGEVFNSSVNHGWYNTANTHKLLGANLTTSFMGVRIPDAATSFNFDDQGLTNFRLRTGDDPNMATLFGVRNQEQTIQVTQNNPLSGNDEQVAEFQAPGGIGLQTMILPTANLTVGLIKDTDLSFRYLPGVTIGIPFTQYNDILNVGYWGVGIKHNWKQWVPVVKRLPFSSSIFLGYTQTSMNFPVVVLAPSGVVNNDPPAGGYLGQQEAAFSNRSFTGQLLVSKKIFVLTGYLGLGYSFSNTHLGLDGTYPLVSFSDGSEPNTNLGDRYVENIDNPVSIDYRNGGFRTTIGGRLKLGPITFHGDYTLARYSMWSAGVGLSFREN